MNPSRPGRPHHEAQPPQPPMPSQTGGETAARSLRPEGYAANESLAPPHDVRPVKSSGERPSIIRPPEAIKRQPAGEHVGPLAVDQTAHIASADDPGARQAAGPEPLPPADTSAERIETGSHTPLPDNTPVEPPTVSEGGNKGPTGPPHVPPEVSNTPEPEPESNKFLQECEAYLAALRTHSPERAAEIDNLPREKEIVRAAYLATYGPTKMADFPEYLEAVYKAQCDLMEHFAADPNTYMFKGESNDGEIPAVRQGLSEVGVFFGKSVTDRHKARMLELAAAVNTNFAGLDPRTDIDQNARGINEVLHALGGLVKVSDYMHSHPYNPAEFARRYGKMSAPMARAVQEFARTHPMPSGTSEFILGHIPRFAWTPHNITDALAAQQGALPPEYLERFGELWRSGEARYFSKPDQIAAGDVPLHMGLSAADAVAGDGHPDAAYLIKSSLYTQTLAREDAGWKKQFPEMCFMHYIFAASCTGQVPLQKGAYFDYGADVSSFMRETWRRISTEAAEGGAGSATNFIQELSASYESYGNSAHVPYLALSLVRQAETFGNIDVAGVLKGLAANNVSCAEELAAYVREQPNRPVLSGEEAAELASNTLRTQEVTAHGAAATRTALEIASQDADICSFKTDVARNEQTVVVISGDVDVTTGTTHATIEYRSPGSTLKQPIDIDLTSGEVSSSIPLDDETTALYRAAVETAIAKQAALAAEAQAAEARRTDGLNLRRAETTGATAYAERQEPKIKTQGEPDPDVVAAELAAIDTGGETTSRNRVTVGNATPESVAALMKDQKIIGIDPQRVIERIHDKLVQSSEGEAMFGKPSFIEHMPGSAAVKLRQINWITEGGRQIRFYFHVKRGGHMELCGIYDKRGDNHQSNYMSKLVKRLAAQERESQSARPDKSESAENADKNNSKSKRRR